MKIDNVEFEYYVDYINKRIHLMDVNAHGQSIINAISSELQKKLIFSEGLLSATIDFEWYCYNYDGIIVSYKDYCYKIESHKMPYLHKPFSKLVESRKRSRRSKT